MPYTSPLLWGGNGLKGDGPRAGIDADRLTLGGVPCAASACAPELGTNLPREGSNTAGRSNAVGRSMQRSPIGARRIGRDESPPDESVVVRVGGGVMEGDIATPPQAPTPTPIPLGGASESKQKSVVTSEPSGIRKRALAG